MTAAHALRIDDWVVHRPNVVRSVAARVPGIDAEEAASRALEKMVRIVSTGGTITDPAPYWRRAAVNEAISMTREAGRTHPVEDDTLDGLTPPVAGAELDAERQADVTMLRTALSGLADDDRQILLDRHVHDRAVTDIAHRLGVRPHAVTMRLRRAEERLAGAFAAAHAHAVNEPECRTTRAAMHDYLKGRLLPRRQRRLEVHMDGCGECTRAFIDVREVSWMLRDFGQHVVAAAVATGALGAGVAGAAGAGVGAGAGTGAAAKPAWFKKKEAAVAAAVLAALAIGGGAFALVANQPDDSPAAESVANPGADGGAGERAGADGGAGERAGAGEGAGGVEGGDAETGGAGTDGRGEPDSGAGGSTGDGAAGGDDGAGAEDEGAGAGNGRGVDGAAGDSTDDGGAGDTDGDGSGAGDTADGAAGNGDADGGDVGDPGSGGRSGGSAKGPTTEDGVGAAPDGAGAPGGTSPGDGGDNRGDNGGGNGDGTGTADDTKSGIGAQVTDWLAALGIGDGSSEEDPRSDATPEGSTADRGDAGDQPDNGGATDSGESEGPTTADGADPGIGAEMTSWLTKLGAIGIPGFLLILVILWLWERWSRTEEG